MRLRCTSGPIAGRSIELESGHAYIFGREPEGAGQLIQLDSRTVSRTHCQIQLLQGGVWVRDLHSSNGTRINRQRIVEAEVKTGDIIQMGEFSFVVEGGSSVSHTARASDSSVSGATEQGAARAQSQVVAGSALKQLGNKFEALEFSKRSLLVMMVAALLGHWITTAPMVSDARVALLNQSFEVARRAVRNLGERNKRELAESSYFLLDCNLVKGASGVLEAFVLDARGKVVCPVGAQLEMDELTETAIFRGDPSDSCEEKVLQGAETDCDLVFPIREWRNQQAQYVTVGASRIRYRPVDAEIAMQSLQGLSWKTLFVILLIFFGVWWLLRRWIEGGVQMAVEAVRVASSQGMQNLERIDSFAAFDPLVHEITRILSKSNQGVSSSGGGPAGEASFLQSIFQQVLLLEERPVMIVDRDNHMMAASASLKDAIPAQTDVLNVHVTDAVGDTHLQGELMALLNDLSSSNEVIDRALSSSDRIIQVRGLPIFTREEYVASLLIF